MMGGAHAGIRAIRTAVPGKHPGGPPGGGARWDEAPASPKLKMKVGLKLNVNGTLIGWWAAAAAVAAVLFEIHCQYWNTTAITSGAIKATT